MFKVNRTTVGCCLVLFGAIIAFTVLSLGRIKQAMPEDDLCVFLPAKMVYMVGLAATSQSTDGMYSQFLNDQPHLYTYFLAGMFKIRGASVMSARLVGILAGILTILLIFLIIKSIAFPGQEKSIRLATLVSSCYALAPTTIQGAVLMQIDTTVLVPLTIFLCWSTIRYYQAKNWLWLWGIGLSFTLSLWARLSTPMAVFAFFACYSLISKHEAAIKVRAIAAFFSGFVIFLISWYAYCKVTAHSFWPVFMYTLNRVSDSSLVANFSRFAQNIFYLMLWLGPLTLFTIVLIAYERRAIFLRASLKRNPALLLFLCGLAIFAGYSVIGGAAFGYPRYYSPAIALIYAGAGLMFIPKDFMYWGIAKNLVIFFLVFFAQVFILGDPLYVIRYLVREAMVYTPTLTAGILYNMFFRFSIFALICFILAIIFVRPLRRNQALIGFFVISSIASNFGITFSQSIARYNTGYNYGGSQISDVVQYLSQKVPKGGAVIAPAEIIYQPDMPFCCYVTNPSWNSTAWLRKQLANPGVFALAYSVTANTVEQIKTIRSDKAINALLRRHFDYKQVYSYDIWTRKREI